MARYSRIVATVCPATNKRSLKTPSTMSFCPNCGSTSIESRVASGESVCTECGVVVEENVIVSSVEFEETAAGTSRMMGTIVGADRTRAYSAGRNEFTRDSRETTLANARKRIQDVAVRLRLPTHFIDGAHRIFSIALKENLVQGRRSAHVVAACLYMACRQEKSQHMLIDFSDALQVNVYTLGHCFLRLRRKLGFKLEIIDPALYVYRFASHLNLDDKATAVSLTAVRLVARMKRDWIVTGRRPQGICAAALLIAARAHGIADVDVTRVLNICGMTVTARLKEFSRTPSSQMSLEEFTKSADDPQVQECDPPRWTQNKLKELRAKAIRARAFDWIESGNADDDTGKKGAKWREPKKITKVQKKFDEMYDEVGRSLNEEATVEDEDDDDNEERSESQDTRKLAAKDTSTSPEKETAIVVKDTANEEAIPEEWKKAFPKGCNGKALVLVTDATEEEQLPPVAQTEGKLNVAEFKATMPDFMDSELDCMFRTDAEYAQREAVFNRVNKDYIEQQEKKQLDRKAAEEASKDQEENDVAQAAGQAKYKKRKKNANSTVEEKLKETMESRRVSRKINYDALSCVFGDDGAFDTTDVAEGAEEEDMFEGL